MIPIPTQGGEDEEGESAAPVWAFLLALLGFKIAVVILIFWQLRTWESGIILGSTLWYWIPPFIVFGSGPVLFYVRLRRVRAKRAALERAEWMVPDGQDVGNHAAHPR